MMRTRRRFLSTGSRPRRQPSALGMLLVIAGLLLAVNLFFPSVVHTLWIVFGLWPILFVAFGLVVLTRKPGWLRELDLNAPPVGAFVDRPRRLAALALIVLGVVLLPFTLHLLDERILGAVLLVGLGVLLIWRRVR